MSRIEETAVEPISDEALEALRWGLPAIHVIEHANVQECMAAVLARLDRAEAALATADAAGFARGVEAAAEAVFASSDLRVDELTPYGRDCREHAQRIRALLPRVTP